MKMAKCAAGRGGEDRAAAEDISELQMLLHPELLSQDFIQLMLQEKNIQVGDDVKTDRDRLTELFMQHITPKPQRKLPHSRWGSRVERRSLTGSHANSSLSSNESGARKRQLIVFDGSPTRTGAIKLKKPEVTPGSGSMDRLKPPPSGNFANPIRKLSSPPANRCSPNITISSPSPTLTSPLGKETAKSQPSPTVKLKRLATSEGDSDSLGELKSPEMKKKIQPITWP
ncbi:ashwin [Paramormyrops kingsleyae]|uniref:Ashwin n=1 Tax=Paramormyrops kingsleyae TaxID=1676925 RepID=A0A3B3SFY7_9TELE|nr:ashwin [Paramormyrops kingsleyae]